MRRTPTTHQPPLTNPVDMLLADVAIRIQLSRTDHDKAVQRYQTINDWIERPSSPLRDRVEIFYPQGSMATGSTIASRLRTDDFDIDVVAQLDLPADITPKKALDLLQTAIQGEPGSRYYGMAKRRTRCVTVDYSDDMHLDVTPMLRRAGTSERESELFHHRPETPHKPGRRCVANPYGFAEWFKETTPLDTEFATAYERRSRDFEFGTVMAKADSEPVPARTPPFRKSRAVIVLQLLKRWRNVRYELRSGRRPPSILLGKLVADGANSTQSLSQELLHQARSMLAEFERWSHAGELIRVANPVCPLDLLTDRWPESFQSQQFFLADLRKLVSKVESLVGELPLDDMKKIMVELFGEAPTVDAFSAFNQRYGEGVRLGQSRHDTGTGRISVPAVAVGGSVMVPSRAKPTPRHTFYGGSRIQ